MNDDVGVRKLGEKLLGEVEVEDLSSVLQSVRELNIRKNDSEYNQTTLRSSFFGIPELDALFPRQLNPILELVSPPEAHHASGAGKTSLLYLIISHAIFPSYFAPSIALGGQNAAIILFDPLNHFSVSRLANVMLNLLKTKVHAAGQTMTARTRADMKTLVKRSMQHIHIFRPQSWPSLLSTLHTLPDYLFNKDKHESTHRHIHSIILEDIDTFTWAIRNSSQSGQTNPLSTASTRLASTLQNLSARFSNATILTSHSTSPTSFRPALPTSWPLQLQQRALPEGARQTGARVDTAAHSTAAAMVTRLAIRRVEVLKFAPAISVEEAEAERQQRWEVVSRARFECWKVGVGVKDGEGFLFSVGRRGVVVERSEGNLG
ncbi:uncharacterized protein K460DRAFT_139779 [Cucurbitaria berberidis CBS 394.84]|uniref:DNA recombination and repair protein Rad51-like C-terminal domain-containing protein n=1 Tax=Cucurbitaria berberidis CBS 394.84 TaxID=1168544 RepID=A0A9P4GD26_9PLEO|nr:uncharacterized protein K460DRAFT_139779 [Cucurbitaria berberidis CBS 394.84]KAF1843116.1 hypothetical protein K460DRAFT_139779 [Cucurbitaria berberidis CBS 394.84]